MAEDTGTKRGLDWRYYTYNALLILLSPLLIVYLLWRMLVRGKSRAGLAERLGAVPPAAAELGGHSDPVIWFQACSVGEVAAVESVITAFREREPLAHVVLSTTTPTGREMARKRKFELDALVYWPFDIPFAIRRAFGAVKPDLLVTVDTELWPNVLAIADNMGIRSAVINGRISDRAYPKDRAIRPLLAWTLSHLGSIMAQSQKDAERFLALGAPEGVVKVLGNCKFDEPMPSVSGAEAEMLRLELGLSADAPVLVAGSTREGEEEQILDAFDILRHEHYGLQLVLAPRHPDRGDAIEGLVSARGYAVYRRSKAVGDDGDGNRNVAEGQVRVIILDTIGELTRVYALATVVFVGGSLVPWGGHNILQPIAQGKPTVMGPWMHNWLDIVGIAVEHGAAMTVQNSQELAEVAGRIIGSEPEQQLMATRGMAMFEQHGGASARYADELVRLLHEGGEESDVPV